MVARNATIIESSLQHVHIHAEKLIVVEVRLNVGSPELGRAGYTARNQGDLLANDRLAPGKSPGTSSI